jgi:hypothetical protein
MQRPDRTYFPRISSGFLIALLVGAVAASVSCYSPAARGSATREDTGHLLPLEAVQLARDVDARQIAVFDDTLYLTEGWPEQLVSRWSLEGEELGPVFERGRAPWKMLEAAEDLVLGPDGSLGLIDMRSYRLSFIDGEETRFLKSFLVSGYEFMPLGGVGDPEHDRIFLFSNNEPEVRVLDFEGRELTSFDYYDKEYTDPYAWFRGAVDDGGNLLYCPRSAYRILRVAPDGSASLFAEAPGHAYAAPLPLPETIADDPSDNEQRYEWEKTVSWVDRLATSRRYVLVSYSVPPGLDDYRVDLYTSDGGLVAAGIGTPGRLLGCGNDHTCWFLDNSKRRLVSRRISS